MDTEVQASHGDTSTTTKARLMFQKKKVLDLRSQL